MHTHNLDNPQYLTEFPRQVFKREIGCSNPHHFELVYKIFQQFPPEPLYKILRQFAESPGDSQLHRDKELLRSVREQSQMTEEQAFALGEEAKHAIWNKVKGKFIKHE